MAEALAPRLARRHTALRLEQQRARSNRKDRR